MEFELDGQRGIEVVLRDGDRTRRFGGVLSPFTDAEHPWHVQDACAGSAGLRWVMGSRAVSMALTRSRLPQRATRLAPRRISAARREGHTMLLELCVAALLCTLGLCLIAELTQRAMRRLGIDARAALLWLGLAERPIEPRTRRRLGELVAEPPGGVLR